jgi:hypothetical protein
MKTATMGSLLEVRATSRWRIPRLRFSLRTLLLLTVLAGSGLALCLPRDLWEMEWSVLLPCTEGKAPSIGCFSAKNDLLLCHGGDQNLTVDLATGRPISDLEAERRGLWDAGWICPQMAGGEYSAALAISGSRQRILWVRADGWSRTCYVNRVPVGEQGVITASGPRMFEVRRPFLGPENIIRVCDGQHREREQINAPARVRQLEFVPGYDDRFLGVLDDGRICLWSRRRSEPWRGVAWLPEFWLTVIFAGGLVWSVWRDRRTL